ncbi:MAG: ImmA/IrrE family metallo-endopeptidase [Terracidiphilus sp.]|jgi:Zn-dependent peptidase ImmA (M78 family)
MSTKREIEEMVSGLLRKHQIFGAPVPVDRVATEEGLPIIEHALQGEVSGALISSNGVSAIAVNSAHHVKRRRFTIAHELAHYLLDHKGDQDHIDWKFTVLRRDGKSSEANNTQEIEANSFAANLLMPREFLLRDLKLQTGSNGEIELSNDQLIALARKYQVSETAMNFRLINLGLISPI